MLNEQQFLRLFPNLYSLGIKNLCEIKQKLIFNGKINSTQDEKWEVIGYACSNPLLQLKLTITNHKDVHKIYYSEEIIEFQAQKVPKISAVSGGLFTRFSLRISGLEQIVFHQEEQKIVPLIQIAS